MLRLFFLSLVVALPATLHSATLTVEEAAARALRSNPDLAAARWGIEEARGRLWHSGRPSNPEAEAEVRPNARGGEFSLSVGFSQKFPLTNRLFLERSISETELKVAEAEVRDAERLLKAEVRAAAVKLLALQSHRTLTEQQQKNSADLAGAALQTAEKGEGSPLDAGPFELEGQQLALELLKMDSERASVAAALRPLLGFKGTETITISGNLPAPAPATKGATPEKRPDYQAAKGKEAAARTGVDLAKAGKWEDAGIGLTAEVERVKDAPEGLRTESFIGVKFSIPLPFWNKNEGKIHEAAAAAARAKQEAAALALRIRAEADAARAEMQAATTIIEQTSGPLMKKARELEDRYIEANKLGQAPMTDVLRSRDRRFALEAARLDALRDYHLARVKLLAALGQ